jgi:hypothetical protein
MERWMRATATLLLAGWCGGAWSRPPDDGAASAPAKATSQSAPAPGLADTWRGARWGMTADELLAALRPEPAFRVEPPIVLPNGRTVAVGIDGHRFHGLTVDVRFLLEDGRLSLVSFRTREGEPVDSAAYDKLVGALAAEWGKALEVTSDTRVIDTRQTRWDRGSDRVDVKYIPGLIAVVRYPRSPGR